MVTSNSQKKLNWEKARKNKYKIMLPASPSLVFSYKDTKLAISDLKSKYIFYPN